MKKIFVLLVALCSIGFSKSLVELGGEAYEKGEYQKAAELWQKSCDSGDTDGCLNLADLYAEGQGVEQDYKKSG